MLEFCYEAWVKKLDWKTGQMVSDGAVYDGDTAHVVFDRGFCDYTHMKFRLALINTPELNAPKGSEAQLKAIEARDWLKAQIEGKKVFIQSTQFDKYGRALALVWINKADIGNVELSVNKVMLKLGLAEPYGG